MRPAFRTGPIHACADFLATVPRTSMIAAIVAHATTQPEYDGQAIQTTHEHAGTRFRIETQADRTQTTIRLS